MRILVFGGRDFVDREFVFACLDRVMAKRRVDAVVHGCARGADSLGGAWAKRHGIEEARFPADWDSYGKRAGHIRNQRMIDEGHLDGAVGFPGGRGTADMIARLERARIPTWLPLQH